MTRASVIRDYIVDYINSDLSKYEGIMLNAEELQCIVIFLEERELYRAIGTAEELKTLHDDYWKLNEICKEYSAIGTVSEFRELKEKATAKKPIETDWLRCPNCDATLLLGEKHCICGQKLDWSEGKE
jgi:hypothetical protein